MGNFGRDNRDSRGGGGRSFGGGSRGGYNNRDRGGFGGGDRGDREMFKTTCSNCGKECEVPFRPTGSKPVYCNDCFRTMGGNDRRSDDRPSRPSFGGDRGGDSRPRSDQPNYREQFEAVNAKLDKIMKMIGGNVSVAQSSNEVELPIVPNEERMVEDVQFKADEMVPVVEKKKRAPKKTASIPAEPEVKTE